MEEKDTFEFENVLDRAIAAVEDGKIAGIDVEVETEVGSVVETWRATVRRDAQVFGMRPVMEISREEN